jgi:hypothetical protein
LAIGFEGHVAFDLDKAVALHKLSTFVIKEEFNFRFGDFELAVFHFEWSRVFNFHFVGYIGDLAGDAV